MKQRVANGEHLNVSLYYYLNNYTGFQQKACFATLCSLFLLPVLPFPTFTHHFTTMWRTHGLGLQDLVLVSPALKKSSLMALSPGNSPSSSPSITLCPILLYHSSYCAAIPYHNPCSELLLASAERSLLNE